MFNQGFKIFYGPIRLQGNQRRLQEVGAPRQEIVRRITAAEPQPLVFTLFVLNRLKKQDITCYKSALQVIVGGFISTFGQS